MQKDYCNLYFLDSFSSKVKKKELAFDPKFEKEHNLLTKEYSDSFDKELLTITKKERSLKDPLLALRCRVSFPIYEKINVIYKQFSNGFEIDLNEMLIILLDDSGEQFLRLPKDPKNPKKFLKKIFCWETVKTMQERKFIKPFSAEIIAEFNPKLSNLSTWTKNKVQGNYELKSYLKSCGLLLISPWALIADSSKTRIINAWKRCGEGELKLNEVEKIYDSYLKIYKKAKEEYKNRTGKISGWSPDENFLLSIEPPQTNTKNLLLIDKAIRQYIAGADNARNFENNEESQLESFKKDEDEFSGKEIAQKVNEKLIIYCSEIIKNIIEIDKKKWVKDPSREDAWKLYGEGFSQRDIASKCNHKQAWVSKLIPEKKISEEIAQDAAIDLLKMNDFETLKNDPDGIERFVDGLRNHLLNPELKEDGSILRNVIKKELYK